MNPHEDQPERVNITMPTDLYQAVKRVARDEERSVAATIRVAIRRYLAEVKS